MARGPLLPEIQEGREEEMGDLGNFWRLPTLPHPPCPIAWPLPELPLQAGCSTIFSNLHFVLIPVWARLWHLPGQVSG